MGQEFEVIGGTKTADFIVSNNQFDYIQGPLGSGKTKAACVRLMRHAQEQQPSPKHGLRLSRFFLARNTMPDLKRSTVRTWLETFPEHIYGRFNSAPGFMQHKISFNDVRTEFDFLSLDKADDVKKLRSTEYTGGFFNELPFMPKEILDEADSRLRFPPDEHGGPTWRGIIADANAPDEDCWLAMMTGQVDLPPGLSEDEREQYRWPADWGLFMQPSALLEQFDDGGKVTGYVVNPHAENLKNLPDTYYSRMWPGKSRAWIDSRLMNRVALVVDGQPVWPMFRREFHVAREPLRPVQGYEVLVSLDFGRVYPAALFGQEVNQRLLVQYEMLGFNEPASVFAPKVKRFLTQNYPGYSVRFVGDPKGRDKGQQTEQSSYDIFEANGMKVLPAPMRSRNINDIEERTEAVAYALNDNPAGVNYLVISPLCRTLIVGMAGRYHLVREEDGVLRPKKDKYSNLCDALQYKVLGRGGGRKMIGMRPIGDIKPGADLHRAKDNAEDRSMTDAEKELLKDIKSGGGQKPLGAHEIVPAAALIQGGYVEALPDHDGPWLQLTKKGEDSLG